MNDRWIDVVFLSGDDALDVLDGLCRVHADGVVFPRPDDDSIRRAVEYLAEWDDGHATDARELVRFEPWGPDDDRVTYGGYVLAWHYGKTYVSLSRRPLDYARDDTRA